MKLDPEKLNKLLEQVSDDVADILAKSESATMAKADPGEEAPGEETPAGSSAEGSQPEAAPEGSAEGSPEGSPAEAQPEAPAGMGDQGSEEQNPATDESAGPEALVAEYAKLPIEELKMHVMAAHAALMQAISGGQPGGQPGQEAQPAPDQSMAPAEGMSPESTPAAGTQPPMGKGEIKSSPGNGGQVKLGKSALEVRLEKLEKSLAEKEKTIESLNAQVGEAVTGLTAFVKKSSNVGLRKSIAGISFAGKPGTEEAKTEKPLSKAEAVAKCNDLTTQKDLKKSDRDLIMSFILGNAPQTTITHLLHK
jgi:hypothetical protein